MANNPIKQHYIPRSYLKNFATCNDKNKCFVDIYLKKNKNILNDIDTKTICYEKNLYTLETDDESKKFDLEIYYANNVDNEFPKIYKLLTDKNKLYLSPQEKLKILYVCLSLYFRTPFFLNRVNNFTDKVFDSLKLYSDNNGIIKTKIFNENKQEYSLGELEALRNIAKTNNKLKFHIEHLKASLFFIQFKNQLFLNYEEKQIYR
ncbi:DUF4238 domain-containing protein, partial [Mesonia mobilis]|uniref:DUF4238 domain-containing protein n=1 Tax=Mesonia mobilis TaxID=369791 RepID=UPI0026F06A92